MNLLLNDLSIHGQFPDIPAFKAAIGRVMAIRSIAHKFSRELYSHRNVTNRRINPALSLFEALQRLPREQKQSLLLWLTKWGPFWEDAAAHGPDNWLQCGEEIVTTTAVGEAAYCATVGIDRLLISLAPSAWTYSPVAVQMEPNSVGVITIPNYWEPTDLRRVLQNTPAPAKSWSNLEEDARARFQYLTFSTECFNYLNGHPFDPGAAASILSRLAVLNQLTSLVDSSGRRTAEGHQLYQDHFTGGRAGFSDSSDSEKNRFRHKLTFPHPEQPNSDLFCPWHGKINSPPFRIHFNWPVSLGAPLYVVYVGWKITV